jgi:hypothetical protein
MSIDSRLLGPKDPRVADDLSNRALLDPTIPRWCQRLTGLQRSTRRQVVRASPRPFRSG